jgi:hypothetical protein
MRTAGVAGFRSEWDRASVLPASIPALTADPVLIRRGTFSVDAAGQVAAAGQNVPYLAADMLELVSSAQRTA